MQLDDGRELNVEWVNGYSDWDAGDTVIPRADSGFGFMVYGTRHTCVSVEETVEAVPDDYPRTSAAIILEAIFPNLMAKVVKLAVRLLLQP